MITRESKPAENIGKATYRIQSDDIIPRFPDDDNKDIDDRHKHVASPVNIRTQMTSIT